MKKGKDKMLTVAEVAERLGESNRNIRNWAAAELFEGAQREETYRGPVWLIPEKALNGFQKPVRGRPPKKKLSANEG